MRTTAEKAQIRERNSKRSSYKFCLYRSDYKKRKSAHTHAAHARGGDE